jgi:hypothetical protein
LVGPKEGKTEQLFRGRRGQRLVLFDAERGKAMPGLRRDDDPGPTAGDDVAELLQHERRTIQIDFEDLSRWGLRGGDASGMDQPCDVAQRRGRLDERVHGLARGRVDRRDARFVSGVARTSAAASAFSWRTSASRRCLPTPTRRAIA